MLGLLFGTICFFSLVLRLHAASRRWGETIVTGVDLFQHQLPARSELTNSFSQNAYLLEVAQRWGETVQSSLHDAPYGRRGSFGNRRRSILFPSYM